MSDDLGIGRYIDISFKFVMAFFIILPLAIWKMVDIVIWICHHIKVY